MLPIAPDQVHNPSEYGSKPDPYSKRSPTRLARCFIISLTYNKDTSLRICASYTGVLTDSKVKTLL
jgi:hypothetical protein